MPSVNASEKDEAWPSLLDAEEAHCSACASCTEAGRTVNPAARTVATANMAAIKIVLFIVK